MGVVTAAGVGGGGEQKGEVDRLGPVGHDGSVVELDDGSHHPHHNPRGQTTAV
jgi:hypothetical protein